MFGPFLKNFCLYCILGLEDGVEILGDGGRKRREQRERKTEKETEIERQRDRKQERDIQRVWIGAKRDRLTEGKRTS